LLKAAEEAALALLRPFDDEGGRAAPFAAGRETLHQPGDQHEERPGDADAGIARDEADQNGARGHQHDRQDEGGLAPPGIADPPDDDAADRTRQEADAVDGEGREKLADVIARGKEGLADDGCQEAVDGEIIPFEHVADDRRRDGLPAGLPNHSIRYRSHVAPPPLVALPSSVPFPKNLSP
jgi:hypothetical protein